MLQDNRTIRLPHGDLALPDFLPDATRGVVRSVCSADLLQCGVRALVMNTFHLMQRPGSSTVRALGGMHKMSAWPRPIITDSGGFQAYSLIHENPKRGQITNNGLLLHAEATGRKLQLTPEKTVQLQLSYGSDVVICLDDCTHVDAPLAAQEAAVARTISWAHRCKREFLHIMEHKRLPREQWPLLFAVIQGGGSRELRARCAAELLEIGFDGFGYGGWPLDGQGHLLEELLAFTRELVPAHLPMHALGVGHPRSIVQCARFGYGLFDSALPTRDARQGRLYTFTTAASDPSAGVVGDWLALTYVEDLKHVKSATPISDRCDCLCCANYSLGYLHHLFKIKDALFPRLATMHNLRFMAQLMERLRSSAHGGEEPNG